MRRINMRLLTLDPERHYPPHVLITDEAEPLTLEMDLASGDDLRLVLRDRPQAGVAYVMSSTYRDRAAVRASYYPLVAFESTPEPDELLRIFNCAKWSERLLEGDWEGDGQRYRVYGCRLTEHYLLEFIYHLYSAGGFVIPGHMGEYRVPECSLPFHIDLAEGRQLGLDPDTVAEIRQHYARDLTSAVTSMTPRERESWGIVRPEDEIERRR